MNLRKNVGKNVKSCCDVEITKAWYGEPIDGSALRVKESNTAREFENELVGKI